MLSHHPTEADYLTADEMRRLLEALAPGQALEGLAEDVVLCDHAQERSFAGRAAVGRFLAAWFRQGFSSVQTEPGTMVRGEAAAVFAFTFHGRQDGPFMGLPPTRQPVALPMVLVCRADGGLLTHAALYYNAGTLLRQLGLGL